LIEKYAVRNIFFRENGINTRRAFDFIYLLTIYFISVRQLISLINI